MLSFTPQALDPEPCSFELVIEEHPDETVVKAHGEIDLASAASLTALLHRVSRLDAPVRLDLAGVEFIDSSGLHAMEAARRGADQCGRSLTIGPLSAAVTRVQQLVGTSRTSAS